ncbi:hypothetical protein [Vibrio hepatarius]|uniref:hypothetical protein n=1 Tax=Vibrio hepatarius TaxID=171383 RepID=UPI0037352E8C
MSEELEMNTSGASVELTDDEMALLQELAPEPEQESAEQPDAPSGEGAVDAAEQTAAMFLSLWERGFQVAAHPKFKFEQSDIDSAVRDIAPALDEYGLMLPQSVLRHGKAPVALTAIGGLWKASMLQATELRAQDKIETLIAQIQAGQEQVAALSQKIEQMQGAVTTEGA